MNKSLTKSILSVRMFAVACTTYQFLGSSSPSTLCEQSTPATIVILPHNNFFGKEAKERRKLKRRTIYEERRLPLHHP
jgi:hypothetical protein